MQGKLDSAEAVARLFEAETVLDRLLERLHTYAHLRHDEDTAQTGPRPARRASAPAMPRSPRNARGSPRNCCRIRRRSSARGWRRPAEDCRRTLLKVLRNKPHVLSAAEETLLARAGEVLSASEQTYSLLTNADMAFPDIPGPAASRCR
jgi:oligoendopeptidase F